MLFGTIKFDECHNYILRVEGHSRQLYMYYTKREAIRRYRDQCGLRYKKICWYDSTRKQN